MVNQLPPRESEFPDSGHAILDRRQGDTRASFSPRAGEQLAEEPTPSGSPKIVFSAPRGLLLLFRTEESQNRQKLAGPRTKEAFQDVQELFWEKRSRLKVTHAAPLATSRRTSRRDGDHKVSHHWDTPDPGDRWN